MNDTTRQLQKLSASGPHRLSFGPESLWYLDKLTPNNPVYNVPFLSRLCGQLDVGAFRKALDALVERQQVLRSIFLPSGGVPVSFVLKKRPVELKLVDLRHLPEAQGEMEARQLAKQEAMRPFHLARDPMLRALLFQLGDEEYRFLFVTHHIIFELGSLAILYGDLSALYNWLATGQPPALPEVRFQDSDFTLWQRNCLQGDHLEKLNKYWKQQLAGAPAVELPLDFPRPRVHSHRGVRHFFDMPGELASAATLFFRNSATTPYRGFLAAFNVFLYCYSGMTDICVGSPFASRCPGIENTIGFFANTLVMRTDFSSDATFRQVIRKVDRVVLRAIANSDLSFEKIVEAVQPPRDPSRTPLFQISFRGRTQPYASLQLHGMNAEPPEFMDNGTAKFDLALELESSTGSACFFEYCTDLFREETIVQMEKDFQDLLRGLVAEPDVPVGTIKVGREICQRVAQRNPGVPKGG